MLTHEQAVPSHAEAPAPALTRSPRTSRNALQPVAVDHVAQVKTKRRAARPPRAIPTVPDLAGMTEAQAMAALAPAIEIGMRPRRRGESAEHYKQLLLGAHKALAAYALSLPAPVPLSDDAGAEVLDALTEVEFKLMALPASDAASAAVKRRIVGSYFTGAPAIGPRIDGALLGFLDEMIAAAFPGPKGNDQKLANLLRQIQQNAADGATYDRNGLTASGRHVDDLSTEQVNLMIEMASVPAQSMTGVTAKVEALVTAARGNIPMLRDDVGGNGPSDDITVSILRDIFAINPRADLRSLRSVSVSTGEPFLDFFRAFAGDVLALAGHGEG